jgi:hypothetical protein
MSALSSNFASPSRGPLAHPAPSASRVPHSVPVGPCKTVAPSLSCSFSSSSPLVIFPQRPESFRPLRFMVVAHQRCRPARTCLAKGKLFVLLSMVSFISSSIGSIRLVSAVLPQLRWNKNRARSPPLLSSLNFGASESFFPIIGEVPLRFSPHLSSFGSFFIRLQ